MLEKTKAAEIKIVQEWCAESSEGKEGQVTLEEAKALLYRLELAREGIDWETDQNVARRIGRRMAECAIRR